LHLKLEPNPIANAFDSVSAPQTSLEKLLTMFGPSFCKLSSGNKATIFSSWAGTLVGSSSLRANRKEIRKAATARHSFSRRTVAQLAAVLQKDWTPQWSSLVAIQPAVPSHLSSASMRARQRARVLRILARHLGKDQPFYALQSQGLDVQRAAAYSRPEDMAAHYLKENARDSTTWTVLHRW